MSGIFQGYANSDGRVRVSAVTKVPAGSANDRGMIVAGNRVIPYLVDTGQSRNFHDGIAFDSATGMLLLGDGTQTPLNISMGGLQVDSRGAVVLADQVGDVIHQGVGLTNAGALAIQAEPIATFIAHLHNNVASTTDPGTFTRASDGLYLGADGNWRVAPDNVPRFENDRLLMEPAITNKCTNYNANPDAGLTGISAGTLIASRVNNPGSIEGAQLALICTEGNVVELVNNTAGGLTANIGGIVGNTNPHTVSGWFNGFGAEFEIGLSTNRTAFTTSKLERVSTILTPIGAGNPFTIFVKANEKVQFILNQLEESPVVTSPVITQGAAASRAKDELSWADSSAFFNQSAGVLSVDYVPLWDKQDISVVTIARILNLFSGDGLLYAQQSITGDGLRFLSFDGTNAAGVIKVGEPSKETIFRVVIRWSNSLPNTLSLGVYAAEVWDWFDTSYDGAFLSDDILRVMLNTPFPARISDIQIFDSYMTESKAEEEFTP